MNVSIIIPVFNEEYNIGDLVDEIYINLIKYNYLYEIIIVDDFSNDNSRIILNNIKDKYKPLIKILSNHKNIGQSLSLVRGISGSKFDTIVTLDGDGQNDPLDLPKLLDIYNKNSYGLVSGIRVKRKDNFIKIISSKIANFIRSRYLKDNCPDTGCSLKVFDKKIFLNFPHFNGVHRFLPALFMAYGKKNFYLEVNHRLRKSGQSKYGTLKRLIYGIRDMYTVRKLIKKIKKRNV